MPEPPEVEEHWSYLLGWFWELSAARTYGFGTPNPLTFSEIAAWVALTGNVATASDVAMLRAMDAALLSAAAREQADAAERAKKRK